MKRSVMFAAGLGLGIIALVVWQGIGTPSHPQLVRPVPGEDAEASLSTSRAAATEALQNRGAGRAATPLPPVDTPIATVFDQLAERADRGDAAAACRLAMELQVCQNELARLEWHAEQALNLTRIDPRAVADTHLEEVERQMVRAQDIVDGFHAVQAHCRDLPEVDASRRLAWWRQALQAGSRVALDAFLRGNALPLNEWLRHADQLVWLRRELEPIAWRAMHAGDLDTAAALMRAYAPQPDWLRLEPLAQVVDVDPEMALSLGFFLQHALSRVSGPADTIGSMRAMVDLQVTALESDLEPDQLQRARSASRGWADAIAPLPVSTPAWGATHRGEDAQERRTRQIEGCAEPLGTP